MYRKWCVITSNPFVFFAVLQVADTESWRMWSVIYRQHSKSIFEFKLVDFDENIRQQSLKASNSWYHFALETYATNM